MWLILLGLVLLIGVGSGIGMLLDPQARTQGIVFPLCLSGVITVPALLGVVWVFRARIEADGGGLRWQGLWGEEKTASWGELVEFYDAIGEKQNASVLVFRDGRKLSWDRSWENTVLLRRLVSEKTGKPWEKRGQRGTAGPLVCRESPGNALFTRIFFPTTTVGLVGFGIGWPATVLLRAKERGELEWFTVVPVLLMALMILGLAAAYVAVTRQFLSRPSGLVITVEDTGFRVEGPEHWSARWSDLQELRSSGIGYEIVTRNGTLRLDNNFSNLRPFLARVQEALPKTEGVAVPRGETRRFGYTDRGYRAFLMLPLCLGLLPLLMAMVTRGLGLPARNPLDGAPVCVPLFLLGAWGYWRTYAAWIELDDDGLTQVGFGGRKRVRWSEIDDYFLTGADAFHFGNIVAHGVRIRFWTGIEEHGALMQAIAARAPKPKTGWSEA